MAEQGNGNGKKGFEGLEDLLSGSEPSKEHEQAPLSPEPESSSGPPWSSSSQASQSAEAQKPNKSKNSAQTSRAKPIGYSGQSPDNSAGKKIAWAVGIVLLLIFIAQSNDDKPSPRSAPTVQPQAAPTRPTETKPPPGTDRVLSINQIRYCLAEEQRLNAMDSLVDTRSGLEVDRFNSYVNDFNSRCGSYRYRDGLLSSARRSIANWNSTYASEGRGRVTSWRGLPASASPTPRSSQVIPSQPAPKPQSSPRPSKLVRDTQEILTALGYEPGPVDGLTGDRTISAVRRFQRDYGFTIDGVVDPQLYSRLYDLRPREAQKQSADSTSRTPGIPVPSRATGTGISASDRRQIEAYCKRLYSTPGDYNKCVNREQSSLMTNPLQATGTGISASDRRQIEAYCKRLYSTPGDYNKCVNREQSSLRTNPLQAAGTRVSASDRRQIEAYCKRLYSTPGDFNKCVNREQSSLRTNPLQAAGTGISASDRRQIEAYCKRLYSTPGDYNKCVNREQSSLRTNPLQAAGTGVSASDRRQIEAYCKRLYSTPGDFNKCVNREQNSLRTN